LAELLCPSLAQIWPQRPFFALWHISGFIFPCFPPELTKQGMTWQYRMSPKMGENGGAKLGLIFQALEIRGLGFGVLG
jgi:hypothetical protein